MKQINISFSKKAVFDEVSLKTAYTGAKNTACSDCFSRISTVNDDDEILSCYWKTACGEITDKLRAFLTGCQISDNNFNMILEVSGAYDEALTPWVESDLFDTLVASVTAAWFRLSLPENAGEHELKALTLLQRAYAKLCQRRRPQRNG